MASVMQYVGARYVPKFATPYEWDINATYEALTIVGYQGNSYTSKIPVPAGVQISDENYWALTNSQSGAVSALNERVTTLETEVMDATGDISALEADTAVLNKAIEAHTKDINKLQELVTFRHDRPQGLGNVVFIGDSYAVLENNWAVLLTQKWGIEPEQYVIAAENSCGFAATGESGNTFVTLLQKVANTKLKDWRDACTHIVILGGTNDRTNPAGTLHGIDDFADTVNAAFIHASVFLAYGSRNLSPDKILSCFNISSYYQEGALKNNWNWCNGVNSALALKSEIQADGVHPNLKGSVRLANAMNAAIITGDGTTNWPYNTSSVEKHYYYEYVYNGNYYLHCTRNSVYTLDTPLSGTTFIELPPLDSAYLSGPSQNLISVTTNIVLIDESGNVNDQIGQVTFNSTGVHIIVPNNVTNVKTVGITPFVLSVPVGLI